MTPEQRFDIVLYRLNSAKSLLDEPKIRKQSQWQSQLQ